MLLLFVAALCFYVFRIFVISVAHDRRAVRISGKVVFPASAAAIFCTTATILLLLNECSIRAISSTEFGFRGIGFWFSGVGTWFVTGAGVVLEGARKFWTAAVACGVTALAVCADCGLVL